MRYDVTGHLAGNQPVRSRQAIVSLRFSNGLGGQICRRASLRNRPTVDVSDGDLQAMVERGYEGAASTDHDQQAQAVGLFLTDALTANLTA